jgi:pSer/pThr/pTyr-binding forkhead associated (FHA) protein
MRYALMHRGTRILLPEQGAVLGRAHSCDIVLEGDDVSRRHGKALEAADGIWIEDLGSDNGTFVNGERIESPRRLEPGDVVTVGSHALRMLVDRTDTSPPSSLPVLAFDEDEGEEHTRAAGALGLRFQGGVGMLAAGMVHRAERDLGSKLERLVDGVRAGRPLPPDDVPMALRFALRLARETRRASWLDAGLTLLASTDVHLTSDIQTDIEDAVRAIGDPVLAGRAADLLRAAGVTDPDLLERIGLLSS